MKNNTEITSQDKLREAGIRVTGPRIRIYEYLLTHRTHPTCDDIYRSLKDEDKSLSLASVYNVTEKLSEVGLVAEIISPDGQKHYDGFLPEHLEGSKVDSVSLVISGECKDCVTGKDLDQNL